MNKRTFWLQDTFTHSEVLVIFCQEFEKMWISSGVMNWTHENYALLPPNEFVEKVALLDTKIYDLSQVLNEVHAYTRKHIPPLSDISEHRVLMNSPEYFALSMLDCIWHDLATKLASVRFKTDLLMNKKAPQTNWSEVNIGLAISIKICDWMIKKAFPLLLQQKNYLEADIDWPGEFTKIMENFTFS